MNLFRKHLIFINSNIYNALDLLNVLGKDAILFVVNHSEELIGSITDGDIRRGLLKGISLEASVDNIIQKHPRFIKKGDIDIQKLIEYRKDNFRILPIVDKDNKVINVINFREIRSYLPIDVVVMAGGRGQRLKPLTDNTPKPLLKVGDKAIMEHNVDRLALYGINNFWFSVKYLGKQIEAYFGDGKNKNININYVWENEPLGTIGAVSKINNFEHDYILVTNSDILTDIDYEHFFLDFIEQDADLSVVTIPYQVNIPYAVLETNNRLVKKFKEKPTYTYFSNGGIYLIKKSALDVIPKDTFFNATDLMEVLISNGKTISSYPLSSYWLDVGKHEDFEKAQYDIKQIKF